MRIFGKRRNIFICAAPPVVFFSFEPRIFLSKASGPLAGLLISKSPIFVRGTTSAADMAQTIASQWFLRAFKSSKIGLKWSSKNNIVVTIISAVAISFLHSSKSSGEVTQPAAAWILNSKLGISRFNAKFAFWLALIRWVSIVISTNLSGVLLTTVIGFCIVKRLQSDLLHAMLLCKFFCITTSLTTDKKWNFS